jgi:hypothetical protein
MRSIWAVARNTILQALRMKIAAAFIVLLIILIPVMGLGVTGDGTIKGKLQSFVTYSLATVSLLLSLLTIIVATYSLADDIKQCRIYMVLTKPIRRYELLLGKLLGVILLDLLLLVPSSAIIYGITRYIPVHNNATIQQMETLDNEFFTARASIKPPQPDVRAEVLQLYEKLKEEKQLPEGVGYGEIIKNLTQLKKLEKQAVGVGGEIRWQFDNIRITDPNQKLFIRYKFDVAVNPPDLNIDGGWMVGDLRQFPMAPQGPGSIYLFQRKDTIRTFRELEVPAHAVASDGHLEVAFINLPTNDTVVIFQPGEGLELLYKAESYTINFIKAVLMIFLRLVFLACIGIFAAAFLSFPVAILLCLLVFCTASVSGFILESFNYLGREIGTIYKFTIGMLIRMIPRFDLYNPSAYLVPARLIGWSLLAKITGLMVCLQSLVVLLFSLLIFKFKEIAKITV